jgi:glycosyltransferase involved in cell wall biosynthesis
MLLDACGAAARKGKALQLLLVGEGPQRATLEAKARAALPEGTVRFIGSVEDVTPYLRASDLFVLPSRYEGMSISLLEATALGMPCLASDIPANRQIADDPLIAFAPVDDVGAWEARLADLQSIAGDEVVESRRDHVRSRFSLDSAATRHLELFESLAASRR